MKPDVFAAAQLWHDEPPPLSQFARCLLAEGDSWFSLGSLVPGGRSNLLLELECQRRTAIVNCAAPGDALSRIVDRRGDPDFDRLLRGQRHARTWDAILLSAGGNDLVDAVGASVVAWQAGRPGAGLLRPALARRPGGTGNAGAGRAVPDPARHVREAGWRRLARDLYAHVAELAARRDAGPSAGRPMVLHTYHVPVARPAGTLLAPQGWLHPALSALGVAPAERQPLVAHLFERLRALLCSFDERSGSPNAVAGVHVFDTAAVPLRAATARARGESGDWSNEIHPNHHGWQRLGAAMGPWIDNLLAARQH